MANGEQDYVRERLLLALTSVLFALVLVASVMTLINR